MIPALLLMLSCSGEPAQDSSPPAAAPSPFEALPAPALLRRASLDLRGVLPSLEELDAVEADPAAFAELSAGWFADPRFQDRMVSLLSERWHTLVDVYDIEHVDYHLDDDDEYLFERSVGEEPLRLIAYIMANDLPWQQVVTADHTMANPMLTAIWPLEVDATSEGWQPARYTDARPDVGVLSTNGFYWRYRTDESNMNRSRAAAMSRLLLCEDFLSRPVSFSLDDAGEDVDDPTDAVHSNPYCLACHAALDPIASSMFGFWWVVLYSDIEDTSYHPERENLGVSYVGVEPGYFGEPMSGLSELGVRVASDSRFYSCAVETFAESLWRRPVTRDDWDTVERLRVDFLENDARPQALLSALLETPSYQAGGLAEGADPALADAETTARMMSPGMAASALEELTGFTWERDGFEQLGNDEFGYRVLAGGVDGYNVFRPQTRPGLTWALVYKRAAQAAAQTAVQTELVAGDPGAGLLQGVDLLHRPGEALFTRQLELLHWRLFGVRAEAAWVEEMGALWTDAEALSDAAEAWSLVLTVMLRDPAFLSY